jgi:ACS family pantothenate transporter-like MFS transporter
MGFWLKSFNKAPHPIPGTTFTVPQINNIPNITVGIFVAMAFCWGWLSDGLGGKRWPFVYAGAVTTLIFSIVMRQMPLYENINGRKIVYYLSQLGFGAGPLILTWINEICSDDTEKRALLVALGNDLAYVVQAVAPNFVWKTTDFPAAKKGYLWSIILQILLIIVTATIQFFLWRDKQNNIVAVSEENSLQSSRGSQSPEQEPNDIDEKKAICTEDVTLASGR